MNNGMTTRVCVPSKEDDCPTHFTLHLVLDAWESVIFIFLFLFLKDLYIILAIIYRVFLLVSFFFPCPRQPLFRHFFWEDSLTCYFLMMDEFHDNGIQ